MFNVSHSRATIRIETGNAIYRWEAARGGQLTGLTIKDGPFRRTLIDPDHPAPNLTFTLPAGVRPLADFPAVFRVQREDPDCFVFSAQTDLAGILTVEQQFEVFRESVVFCEFRVAVNPGRTAKITAAALGFDLNLNRARNLRSHYVSRDPYLKQDVTTTHVLGAIQVALDRSQPIRVPHLLPMVGLDLGWAGTRCYSNRLEMILEDNSSIGGDLLGPTATLSEARGGRWRHRWQLCRRNRETFKAPFFYRNKWALFVGSARTEAGPNADPVRRNNALGARVCHVMYPYIYGTRDWPWCSVPMRQTFYQDVQIAREDPPLQAVDRARALGANMLLIHQFWMKNGGSNGEPMADYRAHKPAWLKAFVKRAHARGLRVLLYLRGIEQYAMYSDFFEKYLKRNWDGLYMDWATPFAMGYAKSTPRHSSVYNYFMFTRALRRRVGDNGVLIGHSIIQAASSYALFDAAVTGEFSVLHAGLISTPDIGTSYGGSACVGVHLIAGNSPDRAMFSGPRAAAFAAGLGWANHPFLEPGKDFARCTAFTRPLWGLINSLESDPVRIFNPAVEPVPFARWSSEALYPVAYKDRAGNVLVIAANLSGAPVSGRVDVDRSVLGLPSGCALKALRVRGTHPARAAGAGLAVQDLPPYGFCGALFTPR